MRMDEPVTLGRWMKRLRADLDMTQEALAARVGCAVQTIRTFEIDKRRPSRELAERLAATLQVAPEERAAFLRLARAPLPPRASGSQGDPAGARLGAPTSTPADSTTMPKDTGAPHASTSAAAPDHAPLLVTKLYLPRPHTQQVLRSRLLARLETGVGGALTLLAAPAGFGKTTLLIDWLSQPAAKPHSVAWLALDASDSDPHQFLRYLIAALQTIAPAVGATTMMLL